MDVGNLARYYGPCDVRFDDGVMRLHCYLRPGAGPARGSVDNRYDVLLHRVDHRRVLLCLPGGVNLHMEAGDIIGRTNEPLSWDVEQYDPRPRGYTDAEFRQLSHGEWSDTP